MITTPQGRFSFTYFDEATIYPDHMKWSFGLPLPWTGKEQVYHDLTTIRRFRAFLRPVAAPVYDLWTSAAYPMGVPVVPFERRLWIDHFNGVDPLASAFERLMYGYCTADVRKHLSFREVSLRRTLNETYGKFAR